ncbi:hypothetical protein [Haloferula sp. BvORR071]|uniref:hypothetical protein n=1 Tax=Haloferula sp. BvORR071 TaxID=1396141 RepID=UPI0005594378|nr:hypothetical protein [Haloferula sp. BvORR071]
MNSRLPRPSLFRSLVFWSGLLVTGFIVWAWGDSARRWCYVRYGPVIPSNRDSGLAFYHSQGSLEHFGVTVDTAMYKIHGSRSGRARFARPGFVTGRLETGEGQEAIASGSGAGDERPLDPVTREFSLGRSRGESLLFIPHWCLLLAVLVGWAGLIYWRHRRIGRLMDGVDAGEVEGGAEA